MSLTIRRATPADEAVVVAFNAALAWETEHKTLDEAVLRRGVRAVFADPAKGFYTVAERPVRPVGYAVIEVEWRYNDEWYYPPTEGGRAVRVFRSRDRAEEECRELMQRFFRERRSTQRSG